MEEPSRAYVSSVAFATRDLKHGVMDGRYDFHHHTTRSIHVKDLHRSSYRLKKTIKGARPSHPPHKLRQAAFNPQFGETSRPSSKHSSVQLARSHFSYSAHHGKEDCPLPRLTLLLYRLIHACALSHTATRHHVGCPSQRQECHKGLLLSPGQGPQWYAAHPSAPARRN